MSTDYKQKPDKHKYRVTLKTIDEIHKEKLDDFKKKHETLPEKKMKLRAFENELADIELDMKGQPVGLDFDIIKRRNSLRVIIRNLQKEISNIENYNFEMEYWSRTSDVLSDYYNLTNGLLYGKNYDSNDETNETINTNNNTNNTVNNTKINTKNIADNISNTNNTNNPSTTNKSKIEVSDELLAITNMGKKRKIKKPVRKRNKKFDVTPTQNIMSLLLGGKEKEEEEVDGTTCRATLQNQYLLIMDKEYACSKSKTMLVRKCKNCKTDKVIIYNESIMSCPICGESDDIFIESEMPSQRETYAEKPKYPYKKLAHCTEKINQFLCKGTANIPQEVFTVLEVEITKHNMDKKTVTIKFLETMLKKHRLSDYYENIMFIYSKITGKKPQHISRAEYDLVLRMFKEAEEVYETKYKPANRNNFLKYTFVLNKIFHIIGRPDIAQHFKLLKSPDKLKIQERIWGNICKDMNWPYYSSSEPVFNL